MNMKKMLSLALAGVMALSLMACSAQNGGDSSENTSSPGSSQSSEETPNNATPESVTLPSLNANKEAAALAVPVTEPLAAVLTAAGKWQISDIHITDLLDIRTESHYNAT